MNSLTCARCGKMHLKGHCHEHDDCLVSRVRALSLNYRIFTREEDNIQEIFLLPCERNQTPCFNTDFEHSNEESRANVSDGPATSHSINGNMNIDHGHGFEVQFPRSALMKKGVMNPNQEFPFSSDNEINSIPKLIKRFPLIPRPIFLTPMHQDIQINSGQINSYNKMSERPRNVQIGEISNKCHFYPNQKPLPRNPSVVSELQREIEAHQLSSSSASSQLSETPGCDPRAVAGPSRSRHEHIRPGCGKKFPSKAQLERHSVVHSKKKLFVCDVCQKCFKHKCHLNRHMPSHSGIKSHECGECGKAFKSRGELKVHMRIHTGEKPFTCDTCGKTFSLNGTLMRHVLIHTGQKPFTCDKCGKAFRHRSALKKHVVIH